MAFKSLLLPKNETNPEKSSPIEKKRIIKISLFNIEEVNAPIMQKKAIVN